MLFIIYNVWSGVWIICLIRFKCGLIWFLRKIVVNSVIVVIVFFVIINFIIIDILVWVYVF